VLKEGQVQAGNEVTVEKYTSATLSLLQVYRDYYDKNKSIATINRHLNAPIAIRIRKRLEEQLQKSLPQE